MLHSKAIEAGCEVVNVNPAYTSKNVLDVEMLKRKNCLNDNINVIFVDWILDET